MVDDEAADDVFQDALELEISEEIAESDNERNQRIVGFVKSRDANSHMASRTNERLIPSFRFRRK